MIKDNRTLSFEHEEEKLWEITEKDGIPIDIIMFSLPMVIFLLMIYFIVYGYRIKKLNKEITDKTFNCISVDGDTSTNDAFKPDSTFPIFAKKMSPTENLLSLVSLFNAVNLPSFNKAKSISEEFDLIINSVFTLNWFYVQLYKVKRFILCFFQEFTQQYL